MGLHHDGPDYVALLASHLGGPVRVAGVLCELFLRGKEKQLSLPLILSCLVLWEVVSRPPDPQPGVGERWYNLNIFETLAIVRNGDRIAPVLEHDLAIVVCEPVGACGRFVSRTANFLHIEPRQEQTPFTGLLVCKSLKTLFILSLVKAPQEATHVLVICELEREEGSKLRRRQGFVSHCHVDSAAGGALEKEIGLIERAGVSIGDLVEPIYVHGLELHQVDMDGLGAVDIVDQVPVLDRAQAGVFAGAPEQSQVSIGGDVPVGCHGQGSHAPANDKTVQGSKAKEGGWDR